MGKIQSLYLETMKRIQERYPKFIPDEVDVEQEYSVSCSLWRGATSHAKNMDVPRKVIEANNCWRKYSRARGMTPGMIMLEQCSEAKASIPMILKFSEKLLAESGLTRF